MNARDEKESRKTKEDEKNMVRTLFKFISIFLGLLNGNGNKKLLLRSNILETKLLFRISRGYFYPLNTY